MLKAARGEWADQLPWAPRTDLWHNSNSLKGTLPARYNRDATLDEIANDIGGAYYKIVPDFINVRSPEDNTDRGIGVYRLRGMSYKAKLAGVERVIKKEGESTLVTYQTPIR